MNKFIAIAGLALLAGCATNAPQQAQQPAVPATQPAANVVEGTGRYAYEGCDNPSSGNIVNIFDDGSANVIVQSEGQQYQAMTAYSYYGKNQPETFRVAILFNKGQEPMELKGSEDPRYELHYLPDGEARPATYVLARNNSYGDWLFMCK